MDEVLVEDGKVAERVPARKPRKWRDLVVATEWDRGVNCGRCC
jgi:hypothetical protein